MAIVGIATPAAKRARCPHCEQFQAQAYKW